MLHRSRITPLQRLAGLEKHQRKKFKNKRFYILSAALEIRSYYFIPVSQAFWEAASTHNLRFFSSPEESWQQCYLQIYTCWYWSYYPVKVSETTLLVTSLPRLVVRIHSEKNNQWKNSNFRVSFSDIIKKKHSFLGFHICSFFLSYCVNLFV